MKFEIDDKTGMIVSQLFIDDYKVTGEQNIESTDLETILQAVKKTQEKLVNKQIQEIQDSKRHISVEPAKKSEWLDIKPTIIKAVIHENDVEISKGNFVSIEKIEQNQKIVDKILSYHNHCNVMLKSLDDSICAKSFIEEQTKRWVENREQIEEMIKYATGKDITELS